MSFQGKFFPIPSLLTSACGYYPRFFSQFIFDKYKLPVRHLMMNLLCVLSLYFFSQINLVQTKGYPIVLRLVLMDAGIECQDVYSNSIFNLWNFESLLGFGKGFHYSLQFDLLIKALVTNSTKSMKQLGILKQ